MTVVALRDQLSDRAIELLQSVGENHGRLAAFTERIDAVAQHFRSLGKLSESGYEIIISLDLCELLDASTDRDVHSIQGELAKRRVLADIGFSRAAMETIREAPIRFTLLPGTIAEILLFLSITYTRNANFTSALKQTRLASVLAQDGSPDALTDAISEASSDLEKTLRAFRQHLAVADRLMDTVEDLVTHPNFVTPNQLGLDRAAFDDDQYHEIFASLSAIRADRVGMSNVSDALNLAVAGSLTSDAQRQIVIHMTRTPSLHKLGKQGVIVDMSVVFSGTLGEFPIICRPDAVWLFGQIMPTMKSTAGAYPLIETIVRSWTAIGSYLRVLEVSKNGDENIRQIDEIFRDMDTLRSNMSIGQLFDQYVQLYIDSALRSEQLGKIDSELIDRNAQISEVKTQDLESGALMRQERIRSIFGVLRSLRGVDRAILTSAVGHADGHSDEGWTPDHSFAFLVDAGLVPLRRMVDGISEVVINHPASADVVAEPVVLVGIQMYRHAEGVGGNVYWPTACKLKRFLRIVAQIEADKSTFLLMALENGGVDYLDLAGPTLLQAWDHVKARAGDRVIRTLQVFGENRTYTCELPLAGFDAHTSIRLTDPEKEAVELFYEATAGDLPGLLVVQFILEAWRNFVDGDSSGSSEATARCI